MSKYGSLRADAPSTSHCKLFLKATLSHHDATMSNPLMQSIYDKRVTDAAYGHYLACMLAIFEALEEPALVQQVLPTTLADARLHRAGAAREDLNALGSSAARKSDALGSSAALRTYFAELLSPAQRRDPDLVVCHHFLHYNAMLSGGAFLGACLCAMGKPSALYRFELGRTADGKRPLPGHEYVRGYMARLDALTLVDRARMVTTMIRVYELTEAIMDEAQALQPDVVREKKKSKKKRAAASAHVQHFDRVVTLAELHEKRGGGGGGALWLSVGGRVLDASGSVSYAPGGAYALFAGREISRCLGDMSLDAADLDDLSYDAAAHCGLWAAKLGAAYPVVGTLQEFPARFRLPEDVFAFDPDEVLDLERPVEAPPREGGEVDGLGLGLELCPITGQTGAECPLGFGGAAAAAAATVSAHEHAAGECPFPFIFLHDPAHGWKVHRGKALLSGGAVLMAVLAWLARAVLVLLSS